MVIDPVTSGVRPTAVVEPIDAKTSATLNPAKVAVVSPSTVKSPMPVFTAQTPSTPAGAVSLAVVAEPGWEAVVVAVIADAVSAEINLIGSVSSEKPDHSSRSGCY